MKPGIFTLVTVLFLFSACRKSEMAASVAVPQEDKVYVSNWENIGETNWQTAHNSDGTVSYTYKRETPQLNSGVMSDGLVAVYTKGYSFNEVSMGKPLGLPFLFYTNEHQTVPFSWEMAKSKGMIDVMVKMPVVDESQFLQGQTGVQFRYIIIPREFLLKNNLTPVAVSKMTYQQLSELLAFTL
jgi:hypothetical protein